MMATPYEQKEVEVLQHVVCMANYQSEETKRVIRLIETVNDLNRRLDRVYKIATDDITSTPLTDEGIQELSRLLEAAVCDDQ